MNPPASQCYFPVQELDQIFPVELLMLRDCLRMTPGTAGRGEKAITQSCLPLAIATCYARPVNRNLFYIIGVIVVIIIVLKVLGLF
jgi:hypothetical protein